MFNKYRLGVDHDLITYYKSEHLENTDFPSYDNLNPIRPDAFIGFPSNMFVNTGSIIYELEDIDNIDEYTK